ncbi:MAG: hypothetical protein IT445_08020 [Phycisphaeraceae bacterium]|nr:hypothetical protein [Phycisphaeraceae bacterium]
MSPNQKAAWFNLIVFAATVALYLTAVPLLAWLFDKPWSSVAVPALGIFGLCGLWGFARVFYRPRPDGMPVTDERDHSIEQEAWRAGMGAFWCVFVFGSIGYWFVMWGLRGVEHVTVPVELFPGFVFVAMFIVVLVQSIVTLQIYGWSRDGEK